MSRAKGQFATNIRAVCLWCLASAVMMTLILVLRPETPRAWRRIQDEDPGD